MSSLQIAFGVCAIVIALGFLIRRLFLNTPDGPGKISLVSAILVNVTLPATLIGAFMRVRHVEAEGLISMALGISVDTFMFILATATTAGLNISLFFYPVIESIAGMEGVAKVAWLDILNLVFNFTVVPINFALSRKPDGETGVVQEASGTTSAEGQVEVELSTLNRPKERLAPQLQENTEIRNVQVVLVVPKEKPVLEPEAESNLVESLKESNCPRELAAVQSAQNSGAGKQQELATPEKKTEEPADISQKSGGALTEGAQEPTFRQICMRIALRVGVNPPLWAIPIGLALGLSGATLPAFLESLLTTIAHANSALSFFVIGLLLDVRISMIKRLYKPALMSLGLRYGVGTALGLILYYTLGTLSIFSPLGRFILLVGFVMPVTVVTSVYAKEWGWDPTFPTLMVNLTIIVSFVLIWILSAAVGLPEMNSSSS
eukprot:m51a1_g5183 hypothetical protein (434) ;mRNA; f:177400-178929